MKSKQLIRVEHGEQWLDPKYNCGVFQKQLSFTLNLFDKVTKNIKL